MIVKSRAGSRSVTIDVHNKGAVVEFQVNDGHVRHDPFQLDILAAGALIAEVVRAIDAAEHAKDARNRRDAEYT